MAGFGGAVKLTGESEYRSALKNITTSLREVSSQLQLNTAKFDANDKSIKNVAQQQEALNKIYKSQETEVAKLRTAYTDFAKKVEDQSKAHKELENKYKEEKTELDRIGKTLGTTSKEYQNQKQKVDELEKAVAKSRQENDNNRNALSRMGTALNKAETDLVNTTKKMDELGKETEQTGKQVKDAGDGFTVFKGIVSNLASTAITTAINGIKKLGSGVINLGKQSLDSYAEYEQLIGGVETLFKDSAKEVEGYANIAYKTAGISANKYMEQVTSFSASLLQGLNGDTAKTAKIADMAIIDMADNANKMGTSMEMIQNAYQGFAKQNYTMLDNLKLGYGGTKSEMARLVKESGVLGKAGEDLTVKNFDQKVSFDKIVEAIHAVQENMGIAGTTAKEASTTIQGSVNSMKSAWQNLLTGIADGNQDLGKLINNFVDSVITAGKNIVPRAKEIVNGIKKLVNNLITDVFPRLKREIPELKPLIEVFEWFIKNKDKVVTAIKLMVGAFAVAKIAKFVTTVGDASKTIIDLVKNIILATTATNTNTTATVANTTAQVAGTGATKALTTAQTLLNKVFLANPIGLVVTTLVAFVAIMKQATKESSELAEMEKKNYDEIQQQTQAVRDNKEAWEDLNKTKQNTIDAGMTELDHYQDLYKELDSIVDENGKVKEGYEQRASFITTTLKDALGVEIDLVGNQVKGMQNLRDSIQEVIEKKKAQIILDSQESMYQEAITKTGEAVDKLTELEGQLSTERAKSEEINNAVARAQEKANNALRFGGVALEAIALKELNNAKKRKETYDQGVRDLENSIAEQKDIIGQYAYAKQQYESNMVLASQGAYDQMTQIEWKHVKNLGDATDAERAQLEGKVNRTQKTIDTLKEVRTEANAKEIDAEIKKNEELLTTQQKALDDYIKKTESTLKEDTGLWKEGLDKQLSTITGKKVEFRDAGNGQIQAYVDGEKIGAPKSKEEMANIALTAINEINAKKGDAKTAGANIAIGVGVGIDNESGGVFDKIRRFGSNLLKNFKNSLEEKSPSKATKQMGEYLLEGLGLGIQSEQKNVLSQVANLGKEIISTFDTSITDNTLGSNLTAQIMDGIPTNINTKVSAIQKANDQSYSYNNMLLAFQDALASMKIELDDEEAGRFVRKTVENAIYT